MTTLQQIILAGIVGGMAAVSAQESVTLEQAVQYALAHHPRIQSARLDVQKARRKVWETTAIGLPQLQLDGSYQQFIEQPVQLIPARIFDPRAPEDAYMPVKFGTERTMKWNATARQLIFNGSYIVGLQSARTYKALSELAAEKTQQKIVEAVVQAYLQTALAQTRFELVQKNIELVGKDYQHTLKLYREGLTDRNAVDQIKMALSTLRGQEADARRAVDVALRMLLWAMGRPVTDTIAIIDPLEGLLRRWNAPADSMPTFDPTQHIDYRIAQRKADGQRLLWKNEKAKALPVIGAFATYGQYAYSNEFDFFSQSDLWNEQSLFGVQVQWPLFTSWARQSRIDQARMEYQKARMETWETEQRLRADFAKAWAAYAHAARQVRLRKEELELAERIAHRTGVKYREGLVSGFQLHQTWLQLFAAQQAYLQAIADFIQQRVVVSHFLNESLFINE